MAYTRGGIREQVFNQLKKEIIALELEPGMMVSENELASRMNVSRMPVHDALMALSQIHLVDIYPQKGSQISLIDIKWVEEGKFIRRTLELAVIKELFDKITDKQLALLKLSAQKQSIFMETEMMEEFFDEDNYFHRMLYLYAEREETWKLVDDVMSSFNRIRNMTLLVKSHQHLIEEHQALIAAVEEKDEKKAEQVLDMHLSNYQKDLEIMREKHPSYFI